MSKMGKFISILLAIAVVFPMALSGCKSSTGKQQVDNSKFVTLKYYYVGTPQQDVNVVQNAMNSILKKSINAEIQLDCLTYDNYEQKLKVMIGAQEDFDLCFTAPWQLNYASNATNGAYADLTSLLPKYAPKLYASLKPEIWNAAKVNGKIYAALNQQIFARQSGFMFNNDYVEKYNIDYKNIKTLSDFANYLITVKNGEPADKTQYMSYKAEWLANYMEQKGWENVGGSSYPGSIVSTDKNPKVFNEYDTPEYKEIITTAKTLQQKGVIRKDILTVANFDKTQLAGGLPNIAPGSDESAAKSYGIKKVVHTAVGDPMLTTSNVTATMTAVSVTSKNPERAVQYLEQINTNKELYNLICHGVEGTHYTKVGNNKYTAVKDSKYNPVSDWMFGNQFNGLIPSESADDLWDQTKKLNDTAKVSVLLGFVYDDSKIKTEESTCSAVVKQYSDVFAAGLYGDQTDTYYAKFLSDLKNAGVDKIIADKQKQVDTFLANKK